MEESCFKIHTGKYFPKPLSFIGYFAMFFGIITILESVWMGLLIFSIGSYLSFNIAGFEIKDGKYRHFNYFLFFRIGKWKKPEVNNISILRKNLGQKTFSQANNSITDNETYYELTLLSDSHSKKERLIRVKEKDMAILLLNKVSELLDLQITEYNPKSLKRR